MTRAELCGDTGHLYRYKNITLLWDGEGHVWLMNKTGQRQIRMTPERLSETMEWLQMPQSECEKYRI